MKIEKQFRKIETMNDKEKNLLLAKILGAFASQEELKLIDPKSKELFDRCFNGMKKF